MWRNKSSHPEIQNNPSQRQELRIQGTILILSTPESFYTYPNIKLTNDNFVHIHIYELAIPRGTNNNWSGGFNGFSLNYLTKHLP